VLRGLETLIMAAPMPAAYGMYASDVALQQVVRSLNQSGISNEQICLMVWPRHHIAKIMREANLLNSERRGTATVEELMGWLMKLGAVIIPTAGFFIRSRAFLHALVMRKDSPGLCGNSGALVGLGFSECDAERLEDQIGETGVLVYVESPERERTTQAVEILRRTGAIETATLEQAWAREAVA